MKRETSRHLEVDVVHDIIAIIIVTMIIIVYLIARYNYTNYGVLLCISCMIYYRYFIEKMYGCRGLCIDTGPVWRTFGAPASGTTTPERADSHPENLLAASESRP